MSGCHAAPMPNPNLVAEIQQIMNEPVMKTDIAKLTASSGTMEQLSTVETIRFVIMPIVNGLQAAVLRLAQEVANLGDGS